MDSEYGTMELNGDSIFVCDMRPGFTEDGVACELPDGNYRLSIVPVDDQGLISFLLQLENTRADHESDIAILGVEMARVGFYKSRLLADAFNSNSEALFDWSDNECEKNTSPWGGHIGKDASPDGYYINVGSDGDCSVKYLLSNGSKVGLKVVPLPSPAQRQADRSWTRIVVSLDTSELSFIDDRDYDLDFEDVRQDVLTELCTIDEGAALIFVDEDSVDVKKEIACFRPTYKGVRRFDVFIDTLVGDNSMDRQLPIETGDAMGRLGENISVEDFAKVIHGVLKTARKLK